MSFPLGEKVFAETFLPRESESWAAVRWTRYGRWSDNGRLCFALHEFRSPWMVERVIYEQTQCHS